MAGVFIKNIDYSLLVVGPIYDHMEKIVKVNELAGYYKFIIVNSGLCHPLISNIEDNVAKFRSLAASNVIYNLGSDDLKYSTNHDNDTSHWLKTLPNAVFLEFKNQTTIIIVNGGVTPQMNRNHLINNTEISFVSNIDNQPWHNKYYGGYGYIISNNPLTLIEPKFYPFSMQMGNKFELNHQTYAQEISPYGLKKTFLL